jgi:hypothetical protein
MQGYANPKLIHKRHIAVLSKQFHQRPSKHLPAKPLGRDHLLITHRAACRDSVALSLDIGHQCLAEHQAGGSIMAKRKKQPPKVQRKKAPTARSKTRKLTKVTRGEAPKRTVKPKRAQVKKAATPVSAEVESVAVEG